MDTTKEFFAHYVDQSDILKHIGYLMDSPEANVTIIISTQYGKDGDLSGWSVIYLQED